MFIDQKKYLKHFKMKYAKKPETSNVYKDMYLHIAKLADDKTVINMLSVNKKFRDPIFFEIIFNSRYPWLKDFKPDNVDWKMFYLEMVYYLSKLQEEYGVKYYPVSDFNPKRIYKKIVSYPNNKNYIIMEINNNFRTPKENMYNLRGYFKRVQNSDPSSILKNNILLPNNLLMGENKNMIISKLLPGTKIDSMSIYFIDERNKDNNFYPFEILFNIKDYKDAKNIQNIWIPLKYVLNIENNFFINSIEGFTDIQDAKNDLYTTYVEQIRDTIQSYIEENNFIYIDNEEELFTDIFSLEISNNTLNILGYENSIDLLKDSFGSEEVFLNLLEISNPITLNIYNLKYYFDILSTQMV